jgi:Fe2+ or Zn2+ uptake regulation protein
MKGVVRKYLRYENHRKTIELDVAPSAKFCHHCGEQMLWGCGAFFFFCESCGQYFEVADTERQSPQFHSAELELSDGTKIICMKRDTNADNQKIRG